MSSTPVANGVCLFVKGLDYQYPGPCSDLVFSFFWKGKPDLVARKVVSQPTSFGGFGVVSIQLKVWALVFQWVRRLDTCCVLGALFLLLLLASLRYFAFECSFPPFFS